MSANAAPPDAIGAAANALRSLISVATSEIQSGHSSAANSSIATLSAQAQCALDLLTDARDSDVLCPKCSPGMQRGLWRALTVFGLAHTSRALLKDLLADTRLEAAELTQTIDSIANSSRAHAKEIEALLGVPASPDLPDAL